MSGRKVLAGAVALLTAMAVAGGCGSQSSDSSQPGTVRLAVTDLQGLEELQREFGAFKACLRTVFRSDPSTRPGRVEV
jgi:phosphonate transport system substrate-binding protein